MVVAKVCSNALPEEDYATLELNVLRLTAPDVKINGEIFLNIGSDPIDLLSLSRNGVGLLERPKSLLTISKPTN